MWFVTTLDKVVDGHEFILSVLLSQVLSDVPVALLLSAMSDTYNGLKEIIIGTNVGAVGTLIASMASLISFKLYSNTDKSTKGEILITVYHCKLCISWLINSSSLHFELYVKGGNKNAI